MKKILASILSTIILLTSISCITAFAEETNVPFVSGHYGFIDFDKYPAVFPQKKAEKLPLDAETENQIKKDYADYCNEYDSTDYNYTVSDVSDVDYYGTLSDGSMLVFCDILGTKYLTKVDTQVIGKYIYEVYTAGMDVMIYKNHQFTGILDEYLKGEVSDDLLDEIAEILYFGKFVTNDSSFDNKSATVQDDPAKSVSTADTARNIKVGNNANGSIPTGQSNSIILFVGLLTLVSGFAFVCIEKRKGH